MTRIPASVATMSASKVPPSKVPPSTPSSSATTSAEPSHAARRPTAPPRIESIRQLECLCESDADADFWQCVAVGACHDLGHICPADDWRVALCELSRHRAELRILSWGESAETFALADATLTSEINLYLTRLLRTDRQPARGKSSASTMLQEASDNRYPGGKRQAGLAEWIVSHMPVHLDYAEPFAGKAGVWCAKPPALRTLLIDSDPEVVDWWRRQAKWREQTRILRTPRSLIADLDDDGHRTNSRALTFRLGCGIRFVELVAYRQIEGLLMLLDPPYQPETRKKLNLYGREMSLPEHVRLLRAACRCVGPVMLCGYESPLYSSVLEDWTVHRRTVTTRGRNKAVECLWLNAACARSASVSTMSLAYHSLASDFRARQGVNRKRERWRANFEAMPPVERRAILLELLDAERTLARPPAESSSVTMRSHVG